MGLPLISDCLPPRAHQVETRVLQRETGGEATVDQLLHGPALTLTRAVCRASGGLRERGGCSDVSPHTQKRGKNPPSKEPAVWTWTLAEGHRRR